MKIELKINRTKKINAEEIIEKTIIPISKTAHIYINGQHIGKEVYVGVYKTRKVKDNCFQVIDIIKGTLKKFANNQCHIGIPKKYIGYKAVIVIRRCDY